MSASTAASGAMEGPTRRERVLRVCSEYQQRLKELTFNCRPVIEELTRKASEHIAYVPDIVRVVGERLRTAEVPSKLPTLYLVDSIVKNLGGDYQSYFSKSIQALFCHVFETCVDAETRKALHKLRLTWPPYFPAHILLAIDRHCHSIDPNWPVQQVVIVTPTPPSPTIFVNRDFFTGSGSGAIHINATHPKPEVVDQLSLRQVKSVAPTTATPTTVVMATVQPVADGIQGNGKAKRSPSPQGDEQVRAKRLRLLAEQRHKKEQLKEELGGRGSKGAVRTVAVSTVTKDPPPSEQGGSSSKRAPPPVVRDPRQQVVDEAVVKATAELWKSLADLENLELHLLQRKKEDLQRKGLSLLSSGTLSHGEYDDFQARLKSLVDARHRRQAPAQVGRARGDPRGDPRKLPARPASPLPPPKMGPPSNAAVQPNPSTLGHPGNRGRGREGERWHPPPEMLPPLPLHRPPSPRGRGFHSVSPPPPHRFERNYGRRRGRRQWRGAAMDEYDMRHHPRGFPPPRGPPLTTPPEQRASAPTSSNLVGTTLDRLKELGVLKEQGRTDKLEIPSLSFDTQQLKERIEAVVSLLHAGDACSSCGQRFTSSSSEEYSRHLDQHFRHNKLQQVDSRRAARGWFLQHDDWLACDGSSEEVPGGGGQSGSVPLGAEPPDPGGVADGGHTSDQSCLVQPGDSGECAFCGEQLEQVWAEEEEAWHFMEAARGPNGKVYHLTCSQDAKGLKLFSPQPATPTTGPVSMASATPTTAPVSMASATPTTAPVAMASATPTTAPVSMASATPTTAPVSMASATPTTAPVAMASATPTTAPVSMASATPTTALVSMASATPTTAPVSMASATPTTAPVSTEFATPTTARANLNQLMFTLFGRAMEDGGREGPVGVSTAEEAGPQSPGIR